MQTEFAFLSHFATGISFSFAFAMITNRMPSTEARSGRARTSGSERNSAEAQRGHHQRWTASINRINVIWRSGWTGTKRPWWRPRLRAFRLRPLALARIKTWKPSPSPSPSPSPLRSQCPLVLPAKEKKGDQDTLSTYSFRFCGPTLSCRFRPCVTRTAGPHWIRTVISFRCERSLWHCDRDTNRLIYLS